MTPHITAIDGTTLEGGGQLVRLSVCLAALIGRPIEIDNIRGNRSGGGGLKEQHLCCVRWLAQACGAAVEGMVLKSRRLSFVPGNTRGQWWIPAMISHNGKQLRVRATSVQLATSGAVTLVLQALLPFLVFAGAEDPNVAEDTRAGQSEADANSLQEPMHRLNLNSDSTSFFKQPEPILLTIHGGTNVSNSPSIDYVAQVLLHNYALLGLPPIEVLDYPNNETCNDNDRYAKGAPTRSYPTLKRDWATRTGPSTAIGKASFLIYPLPQSTTLPPPRFPPSHSKHIHHSERGINTITKLTATILAPADLLDHIRTQCTILLQQHFHPRLSSDPAPVVEISRATAPTAHPRHMHILLVAHTASGSRLGADCLLGERVGRTLAERRASAERLVLRAVGVLVGQVRGYQSVGMGMNGDIGMNSDTGAGTGIGMDLDMGMGMETAALRSLDEWTQDQIVVFVALAQARARVEREGERESHEDRYQRRQREHRRNENENANENGDKQRDKHASPGAAASQSSSPSPSLHTLTARWAAEQILGVRFDESGACEGMGYVVGSSGGMPKA